MKIVHDYLLQMGGAERVVGLMAQAFPDAPILTSATNYDALLPSLQHSTIRNSWMQYLPGIRIHYKAYFPLYPFAFRSFNTIDDPVVWLSSSGFSKWINFSARSIVFAYIHTPPRFFWDSEGYLEHEARNPLLRALAIALLDRMRSSDVYHSQKMTYLIANSQCVRERIQRFYSRDAVVINPPVEVDRFSVSHSRQDYFLIVSRLVGYKALDLAILACNRFKRKLIVIGEGPARKSLERIAGATVTFLGRQPEDVVIHHMQNCTALLFPGIEDFGIAPVEAQACGTPVIAFRGGGALETIIEGRTGLFFDDPTPDSLGRMLPVAERMSWSRDAIRAHAETFSARRFLERMVTFMSERTNEPLQGVNHAVLR